MQNTYWWATSEESTLRHSVNPQTTVGLPWVEKASASYLYFLWQTLYMSFVEVEFVFTPLEAGAPPKDRLDADQRANIRKSPVEVYLANFDVLSGPGWFNADPKVWLGIVASGILGQRFFMYRLVEHAIATADDPVDTEIKEKPPLSVV